MSEELAYRELMLKTSQSFLDARFSIKLKSTSRNLLWIANYCVNRVRRTQGLDPISQSIKGLYESLETDIPDNQARPGDLVFFVQPETTELLEVSIITRTNPVLRTLTVLGSRIIECEVARFPLKSAFRGVCRSAGKWFQRVTQLTPNAAVRPSSQGTKTFFLTPGNNSELVKTVLEEMGFRRATSQASAGLIWTQLVKQVQSEKLSNGRKLVNHLPSLSALITTKKALRHTTKQIPAFPVPITYDLSDRFDYITFLSVTSNSPSDAKWILKPFALNQGIGITLVSSIPQFRKDLQSGKESRKKVIQLYIAQPLLLEGHKFDIRYYVLVARCRPMVVLRYDEYYIRRSLNPFSLTSPNLLTHLTNAHQQKSHPDFEEQKEASIWSKEHFTEILGEDAVHQIETSIVSILTRLFAFIGPQIEQRTGSFELLGFDFMMDMSQKVYLLEANTNPALYTDTEVLGTVIPKMLREALKVVIAANAGEEKECAQGTEWKLLFPAS